MKDDADKETAMKIELTKKEFSEFKQEGTFHAAVEAELASRELRVASYARLTADNLIERSRKEKRTPEEAVDTLVCHDLTYAPSYYPNGL